MKKWSVACSGGPLDGRVVELEALGRRLIGGAKLFADGRMTIAEYDYTGFVPERHAAFARFTEEVPL